MPGVAQGGIQGGKYAAKVDSRRPRRRGDAPFRYSEPGRRRRSSGGCRASRTSRGWGRSGGRAASSPGCCGSGIHIAYLIGFANRLVVLIRWAWSFLTHGRGSRLITGQPLLPPIEEPEPPVMAPLDESSEARDNDLPGG